jgi:hypothetical protein
VILLQQAACFHYRVVAPDPSPATEYRTRTVHSFAWGLLEKDARATGCEPSNAIDEVRVRTNVGYLLVTIVTLGTWAPLTVDWRCAKPTAALPYGAALGGAPDLPCLAT